MDNLIFTKEINMDKTNNFLTHLDKAKAEKQKEQEIENTTQTLATLTAKLMWFFVYNACYYAAYIVLSAKFGWVVFTYKELLIVHISIGLLFLNLGNLFKNLKS